MASLLLNLNLSDSSPREIADRFRPVLIAAFGYDAIERHQEFVVKCDGNTLHYRYSSLRDGMMFLYESHTICVPVSDRASLPRRRCAGTERDRQRVCLRS